MKKGFTLIELLLTFVGVILMTILALIAYKKVSIENHNRAEFSTITFLMKTIDDIYGKNNKYKDFSASSLVKLNLVPESITVSSTGQMYNMKYQETDLIQIVPNDYTYTMNLNVPHGVCRLIIGDLYNNFKNISINNVKIKTSENSILSNKNTGLQQCNDTSSSESKVNMILDTYIQ